MGSTNNSCSISAGTFCLPSSNIYFCIIKIFARRVLRQAYMYKTLLECPWLMGDINSNSESSSAAGDDSKDDMVNFQCVFSLALYTLTGNYSHFSLE